MKNIPIERFCTFHNIPQSFIDTLRNFGLIEVVEQEDEYFITTDELDKIERLIRLHYDLDVNMEGLDIINNLLDRIDELQEEILELRRRLNFYEE